jgi:hypothetical protein
MPPCIDEPMVKRKRIKSAQIWAGTKWGWGDPGSAYALKT